VTVTRRRFMVLATALVAVNVFFWLAQSGFAMPGILQTLFGGRMIRAEVVWQAPDGTIQDTELYRGVVIAASPTSITLREKDRASDVIPVAANAVVHYGTQTITVAQLRRGLRVIVAKPANASADTIQVEGFGG
jgi:hypothetical protein